MKARKKGAGKVTPGIPGMQVMKEAVAPAHGFKKGGRVGQVKAEGSGGAAAGSKAPTRLDRPPRATMRGRSPYSTAGKLSPAK